MSSRWLWYISRADGVVTLVLLTIVVLLGMYTAGRPRPHSAVPTMAMGLHRTLGLGIAVFLAAHIGTALVDTYVHLGWLSPVLPFASPYHRVWVGLGAIGFDIFVALIVTSLLRQRLSTRVWRAVHWFSYAMAPLAVVHGLMMATATEPLFQAVTVACAVAMAAGAGWRWLSRDADARRRADIVAQDWS